jgi:hypothetical protein
MNASCQKVELKVACFPLTVRATVKSLVTRWVHSARMWWLIGWDVGTDLTNRMWIGMWRLLGRALLASGWDAMVS